MRNLFPILLSFFVTSAFAQQPAFVYWLGLQGGASYATAVPLPAGRALRLNHHQGKGHYDYFVVDLKGGQTLVLTLATGMKGIEVRPDNTFVENDAPYAGLEVHGSQGVRLGTIEIVRDRNLQKTLEVDASTSQRLYLLIGSSREGMHKDYVLFRADLRSNFDVGGVRDAGSSFETALPLRSGQQYPVNYLTSNDDADYFRIPTSPGVRVNLRVTPENPKTHLQAALYDEVRKELGRARSPRPGAGFSVSGQATGGVVYLRVMRDVGDEATRYSIEFPEPPLPPVVKLPLDYRPEFLKTRPWVSRFLRFAAPLR